jgi:hypothetical protein
MSLYEGQEE